MGSYLEIQKYYSTSACNFVLSGQVFLTSYDFNFAMQRTQIQLHIELHTGPVSSVLVVLAGIEDSPLHRSEPSHDCGTFR